MNKAKSERPGLLRSTQASRGTAPQCPTTPILRTAPERVKLWRLIFKPQVDDSSNQVRS